MMMLRIYDGSNYYRNAIETDSSGLTPRGLFVEMSKLDPHVLSIWVWDGPGNNDYRRSIFPDYKMNRQPPAENIYASMSLFKKVLRHSRAIVIEVPGYEGDDVIATLAKRYAQKEDMLVGIYSNDFDFYQLGLYDNIVWGGKPKEGVGPADVPLYKTLVGDPADNIKGIPGFGKKAWENCNMHEFEAWLREDVPIKDWIDPHETLEEVFWISKRAANWLRDGGDELLRKYWKIVHFREVPLDVIEAHTVVGDGNFAAGDKMLREFFL